MQDYISLPTLSEKIKEMSIVPWLFIKNPEHDNQSVFFETQK
jgi:hypothetical protein